MRHRSTKLCGLYHFDVCFESEAGAATYVWAGIVEKLHYACHGSFLLSVLLYRTSDAFFHVGCYGTGLHENRPCQRSFPDGPVVTYLGPLLAYTVTGSFIVEKIFTIPGLGSEFIGSITGRDYPLIMGTTIFLATLMVIMNVLVDVAYKFIDPRINLK